MMDPELLRQLQEGCRTGNPIVLFEGGVIRRAQRDLRIKDELDARKAIGYKSSSEFKEERVASRAYRNNPGHTLENYLLDYRGTVVYLSFFKTPAGAMIIKSFHRADHGSL